MVEDKNVQTLIDLGLTLLQAKAYLALCKTGTAKVKTISKTSNIARQDVYRIMPTLQKLGLVEKVVASPTMYKPISMKEGYYILLHNKTDEYVRLQNKTIGIIETLNKHNNKTMLQDDTQFIISSSMNLLMKRLIEGLERVQKTIDMSGKLQEITWLFFPQEELFKNALKRGVKIRMLVEKQVDDTMIEKVFQVVKMNPLFEVRKFSQGTPFRTAIYDLNEVNFCLIEPTGNNLPSLWTNNQVLVKVVKTYFQEKWEQSR